MGGKKLILTVCRFIKFILLKIKYTFLIRRNIENIFENTKDSILFITHNYSGGTALFEKNYLSEMSESFIICRMISYKQNLALKIEKCGKSFYCKPDFFEKILLYKYKKIVFNSFANFYKIKKYFDLLIDYKQKNPKINFLYMVHDFHCVCPTINLVADNWNCNLECQKYNCKFNSFSNHFDKNINQWRKNWFELLFVTDEIRCFSESSKQIVQKAYPLLSDKKFKVIPHNMSYCKFSPIKNVEKLPLHIGIVGLIDTVFKGKLVVRELLKRIPEEIPISLIGVTKKQIGGKNRKNTHYLGKYNHDDLQRLVEQETISMEIFPSIWSETFSYLVSEHIAMNIPVVCFDMGAQAEKVRNYEKGIVVKDVDEMIDVIMKQFKKSE